MAIATPTFEKAQGFINLEIIQKDGTMLKMSKGIPLRESNGVENALYTFLKNHPDTEVKIKGKFQDVVDNSDMTVEL